MQLPADQRHPARKSRFWARPIERLARRKAPAGQPAVLCPQPPVLDEGDELLRRLREAGL